MAHPMQHYGERDKKPMMSDLEIRHAQNDRWYIVDRNQNTYGSTNGFATRQEAQTWVDELESEEDDE